MLIGSLAGAVTMLLLAPQSGEDTRTQIQEKGRYYIEVTARYASGDGIPKGLDYQLHVSVEQHAEDSFVFAPAPVGELEGLNNSGQVLDAPGTSGLDAGNNFFTFFDPNIGRVIFLAFWSVC